VVVVTHNLPLAMRVSDRVVVLDPRRKVADIATSLAGKDRVVSWTTGAAVQGE
jgi:ABC-type nitrate/sulfonate/bicarbonate transport system ATPase subunit